MLAAQKLNYGYAALLELKISSDENRALLRKCPMFAWKLAYGLNVLLKASLATEENLDFLLENPEYAEGLASGLAILHIADLLDKPNRRFLLQKAEDAAELALGMVELATANLLTVVNRAILKKAAQYAYDAAKAMIVLRDKDLLNGENLNAIFGPYAPPHELSNDEEPELRVPEKVLCLAIAKVNSIGYLSQASLKVLCANKESAMSLFIGYQTLINAALLPSEFDEYVKMINTMPVFAKEMTDGIVVLRQNGLLDPENIEVLRKQPNYAYGLALSLAWLHINGCFDLEIRDLAIKKASYGVRLSLGLKTLNAAGLSTLAGVRFLCEHANKADTIAAYYSVAAMAGLLLDDSLLQFIAKRGNGEIYYLKKFLEKTWLDRLTFKVLLSSRFNARLYRAFTVLSTGGLLTPSNRLIVLKNSEFADKLAIAMLNLHQVGLDTGANIKAFIDVKKFAGSLNAAFEQFLKMECMTQENFSMLCSHPAAAEEYIFCVRHMREIMQNNTAYLPRVIFTAIVSGFINIIQSLLAIGVEFTVVGYVAQSPLMTAFRANQFDTLALLLPHIRSFALQPGGTVLTNINTLIAAGRADICLELIVRELNPIEKLNLQSMLPVIGAEAIATAIARVDNSAWERRALAVSFYQGANKKTAQLEKKNGCCGA